MIQLEVLARELVKAISDLHAESGAKSFAATAKAYEALDQELMELSQNRERYAALIKRALANDDNDDEIEIHPIVSVAKDGVWLSSWTWVRKTKDEALLDS